MNRRDCDQNSSGAPTAILRWHCRLRSLERWWRPQDLEQPSGRPPENRTIASGHIGLPQNGWFIRGNPVKMDDLGVWGYPDFRKPPLGPLMFIVTKHIEPCDMPDL